MTSIIDLSNVTTSADGNERYIVYENNKTNSSSNIPNDSLGFTTLNENELMLKSIFPDKLLFTIKEVSDILNISYEFIRQQIIKGKIPAIGFGDRRMVNISTLVKILTYGV